ncbi:MAG: RhuM family protein [Campylobacterota bacterium]|nr:RhuM family protein [Campylobacterota bacterium]
MSDIVVYENGEIELKVSDRKDTLWASINDIAKVFDIDRSVVSRHIKNIFKDNELDEKEVCANFAHTTKHGSQSNKTQTRDIKYYSLDIILAVGYRTNSIKAIHFRKWATSVLKEYITNGYTINSDKITHDRFLSLENKVELLSAKLDLLESKQLKPSQGIFYNGQVFDAYTFISDLIREANEEIILIDNYIDDSTFTIFSKAPNIKVTIYTHIISKQLKLDLEKYNTQYNNITLKILKDSHDRFIIIDNKEIYHIGASLKDLGKKWFAFSKMDIGLFEGIVSKLN